MKTIFMEVQPENVTVVLKEIDGFVNAERAIIKINGNAYRAVGGVLDLDAGEMTYMMLRDVRGGQRPPMANLKPRPGVR